MQPQSSRVAPANSAVRIGEPVSDSDYVQLSRLITEITWRIDHGRAGKVHELFAEDGVLYLGGDRVVSGREALRQWGQERERAGLRTRHAVTNMRFLSDGPDAATGTSLLTVYVAEDDKIGSSLPGNIGEDHDRFVRTEHGWRLAERRWEELFARPQT